MPGVSIGVGNARLFIERYDLWKTVCVILYGHSTPAFAMGTEGPVKRRRTRRKSAVPTRECPCTIGRRLPHLHANTVVEHLLPFLEIPGVSHEVF